MYWHLQSGHQRNRRYTKSNSRGSIDRELLPLRTAAAATRASPAATRRRRRQRRLWSKDFLHCAVSALFIRIAAAHTDGSDELIFYDNRQSAADEVVRQSFFLTEVDSDHASFDTVKALRHCGRGRSRVESGFRLQQCRLVSDRKHAVHLMAVDDVAHRIQDEDRDRDIARLLFLPLDTSIDNSARCIGIDCHLVESSLGNIIGH